MRTVPGVLLAGAAAAVQRNDFISADSCFTHRTLLPARPRLQPLTGGTEDFNNEMVHKPSQEPAEC